MELGDQSSLETGSSLCKFLEESRELILSAWEQATRQRLGQTELPSPILRDELPWVLGCVSDELRSSNHPERGALSDASRSHALDRLDRGFDLLAVSEEVALLRDVILELWEVHARGRPAAEVLRETRRLNRALDHMVGTSVHAYAAARERSLAALERLSAAALGSTDLGTFLPNLSEVLLRTNAAADLVKVFLLDDKTLHLAASAGRPAPEHDVISMEIGEGFAGLVAQKREPILLQDAWREPRVKDPGIRSRRVKAMYGIPLLHEDTLIGVAEVGSCTASDFSDDDKQLFRTMGRRITSLLVQAQLVAKLRQSETRFRTLANSVPSLLFEADAHGASTWVSDSWSEMTGLDLQHSVGTGWRKAIHPDDLASTDAAWKEAIAKAKPVEMRERIRTSDGAYRWFLMRAAPMVGAGGQVERWIGSATDIDAMVAAESFRERFVGILGHDLRNPLQVVSLSATHLAKVEDLPEQFHRPVARILSAATRMLRMTNDLLDLTRGRLGGGIPVHPAPTDLRQVARQVIEEVEVEFPRRSFELVADGDFTGRWDPDRIQQALHNLIRNAHLYGEKDAPVQVTLKPLASSVVIEVHNQGSPIPAELLPQLFDPFRRHTQQAEGLGLGLYIVKEVARAHGGSVSVTSDAQTGTTFALVLPRRTAATQDQSDRG